MNNSKLTPQQAINILDRMAVLNINKFSRDIYTQLADVIRDLVKQAESNVKMRSDMLAAPENQDTE